MHPSLAPSAWLAQDVLRPNEQLYAVLSNASDARPLAAWQATAAGMRPQSLWAGTPYAEWDEVMPCVGIVEPGSAFLDWIAATEATDWGWLAVSSSSLEEVIAHLQSLTKVYLADDNAVFLRFWDGLQFLPIMQKLGEEAGSVLPVFRCYWINGESLTVTTRPVTAAKPSPWWRVPASLLKQLAEQSPQTLIENLLQWLEEQRPDLYAAFSLSILRHKVAYLVREPLVDYQALVNHLESESCSTPWLVA